MYIVIGALLTVFALSEINKVESHGKFFFRLSFIILTLIVCFRFGQGTDYLSYKMQYETLSSSGSFLVKSIDHGELGWYIIMRVFKRIGFNAEMFISVISLITMGGIYKCINKFSPLKNISILLLFPTYYLTYSFSAIRQGLVLSVFLSLGVGLLMNRKYYKYIVLIILLSFIHASALILVFLPLICKIYRGRYGWKAIAGIILVTILGYTGILNRIATLFGVAVYLKTSISILAIIVRIIIMFCISRFHKTITKVINNNLECFLFNLYTVGFIIFIMLSFTSTLSQRITMPLKAIEIILIPLQLSLINSIRHNRLYIDLTRIRIGNLSTLVLALILICIVNTELIKNVNSYIDQGRYVATINVFNYPYISIFNKEDLWKYRT